MKLYDILSVLPFYRVHHDKNVTINHIQINHLQVEKNDIFICIKGYTVDGHDFAQAAVERGASVIIAERALYDIEQTVVIVPNTIRALAILTAKFYDFPSNKMQLIGITGTNGKTTTSYLIEEIMRNHNKKTGLIGTLHAKIDDETKELTNTTPDALQLQQIFHQMVDKEVDVAIMEVSSHALHIGRVYGCDFNIALFTNLSQDHLDYHENMTHYLRAKTLLFTLLGNTYTNNMKYAVVNWDDPAATYIMKHTAQHVITYGIKKDANIVAKQIELHASCTTFVLETPDGQVNIKSPLIGQFNVYNMLAAAAVAFVLHIPLLQIKMSLEHFTGVSGRFERVHIGQNFTVIVDYAHTPDSLENVLQTINEFKQGDVYVVIGTGGDRDRTKRPLMAQVATQYAHLAIFTSDNPRTEEPQQIINDMTKSLQCKNYLVIENRTKAIEQSIQLAKKNDVVLIAGKGHETYQEINGVRYPFNDREVAITAIKQKVNEHDMYDE